MVVSNPLRLWRNWQTRQVEGLVSFLDVVVRIHSAAPYLKRTYGDSPRVLFCGACELDSATLSPAGTIR